MKHIQYAKSLLSFTFTSIGVRLFNSLTRLLFNFANVLVLGLVINITSRAQDFSPDQEDYDKPIFLPGIYLTFDDFISNYPIQLSQIQTDINPDSRDFYNHLVKENNVTVTQGDSVYTINPKRMWGYSDGKGVYLNREVFPKGYLEYAGAVKDVSINPWAKINILGTLSLIYYIKTTRDRYYRIVTNPAGPLAANARSKPKKFILDTKDGSLYKATLENLERLINHDAELLYDLKNYRGDKDIKFYIFLKKYNEKYPTNFH